MDGAAGAVVLMGKKTPNRFLPGWFFQRAKRRQRVADVRARDGDLCWRCHNPMRFGGKPNCGKAATVEHVRPLSKGGTWALDNLRLCHVGCNRHLRDHDPAQKERMRINIPVTDK